MMNMHFTHHPRRSTSALMIVSLLGLGACDLGPKSIGLEPDTETGGEDTGEEETTDEGDGGDFEEGNDTTDGDDEPSSGLCGEETTTIITDLTTIPEGFELSVEDIIASAEGNYEGTFSWNENDGPVMITHAGTSSALTMALAHLDGEVRFTEVEFAGEFPGGQEGGEPCSNHLEIDIQFNFVTADGLFAESLTLPLDVYSHSEDPGPRIYHALDMDAHMGTLSIDDFSFTDAEIDALILTASFDGDVSEGGLAMQVLTMGWVGFGGVAGFDAERVVDP
jgi:hypothetical protein